MQQNERKGAWTLFVAILIFGAIVWGYGGYQRDLQKREAETIKLEKIEDSGLTTIDSVNVTSQKKHKSQSSNTPKSIRGGKRGSVRTQKSAAEPVRDILSDSINRVR